MTFLTIKLVIIISFGEEGVLWVFQTFVIMFEIHCTNRANVEIDRIWAVLGIIVIILLLCHFMLTVKLEDIIYFVLEGS